jgi:xanthine dehydrogenase/oxidase
MRSQTLECGCGVQIGGGVTLSKLLERCVLLQQGKPGGVLAALEKQLRLFAGVQIRNVATVAGNLVTASPISDLNPIWVAAEAELLLQSTSGTRTVAAKNFFLGYRSACTSLLPATSRP